MNNYQYLWPLGEATDIIINYSEYYITPVIIMKTLLIILRQELSFTLPLPTLRTTLWVFPNASLECTDVTIDEKFYFGYIQIQ